jgi:NAD(P)-dependent dehydrogenase (short-subunit alcohol dehydrogenase family)
VGNGIGGAICQSLAASGARVVCTGIEPASDAAIVEEISESGGSAMSFSLDVRKEIDWNAAIDAAVGEFGGLDVLVNNAGVFEMTPLVDTTLAQFQTMQRVNVEGVFLGMREGVRAMRPDGAAGNGGSIINISSVAATTGALDHVAYGSSKGAVSSMTRHVASECAANNYGIRVNAICPGVIHTGMFIDTPENKQWIIDTHPLGIGGTTDIASAALYLASDASRWVTGTELTVDGGFKIRS